MKYTHYEPLVSAPDDYAPREPVRRRRTLLEPFGNALAAVCASVALAGAALALSASQSDYLGKLPGDPATLQDVSRWTRLGCTTDTDCVRWEAWRESVCGSIEGCDYLDNLMLEGYDDAY